MAISKNNVNNVTFGVPKVAGAVFVAPLSAKEHIPTDATTELNEAFKNLGYVSEDGVSNSNSPETDTIKAWGGDTVLVSQSSKEDTFSFKLIESLNVEVLKIVYGADNVSGDLTSGITVKANSKPLNDNIMVIDMIAKNNVLKRIVIPVASIGELGDVEYSGSDAVGYEVTIKCLPDQNGNTHYEYIKNPQQSQ